MYLSQGVSLPAPLRVKSDFFLCLYLVQEIHLESAEVTCRVMVPTYPAVLVHSRQASRPPSVAIGVAPRM
jgi:hypothetical protein